MFPPFDQFSGKQLRSLSLFGLVTMLIAIATTIGLQELADSLKGEYHHPFFIMTILFPLLFLLGVALLVYGAVCTFFIKKTNARRLGIVMIAMGVILLFSGFYYG